MSISVKCRKCGRRYSVKDEHAGKQFRCQECQAPVKVPQAEAFSEDPWETEDSHDDFGFDDYEDYESEHPLPTPRRSARKQKPVAKKKRPKKSSDSGSGIGAAIGVVIGKTGGGLFVGLMVMLFVIRISFGSWDSYTTPDGLITVQMPGKVRSVTGTRWAPEEQRYTADRLGYACTIIIAPLRAEFQGLSEEEIIQTYQTGLRLAGITNLNRTTVNGHACLAFDQPPEDGIKTTSLAFIHKGNTYTLNYSYKGSKGSHERKFFDSVQFN